MKEISKNKYVGWVGLGWLVGWLVGWVGGEWEENGGLENGPNSFVIYLEWLVTPPFK